MLELLLIDMWNLNDAIIFLICALLTLAVEGNGSKYETLDPTITVSILARNAAANLPWFLGSLEKLDYPKDRISIW